MIQSAWAGVPTARWASLADTLFIHNTDPNLTSGTAITQDGAGFIWVGGQGGLSRWDGYHLRHYVADPQIAGSLQDSYIAALHTDRRGRLWIGGNTGGLARYDPEQDRFIAYPLVSAGSHPISIKGIIDDDHGGLWVASTLGLMHLEGADNKARLSLDRSSTHQWPESGVEAVLLDRSGALWAGTHVGLFRRASPSAPFSPIALGTKTGAAADVTHLFQDSRGRIWVGTRGSGAFVVKPGGIAAAPVRASQGGATLQSESVPAIVEASPGVIWLTTMGDGIFVIDTNTGETQRIVHHPDAPSSLAENTVVALFRDRSGLIWVTSNRALSHHDPNQKALTAILGATNRANGITDVDVPYVKTMRDGHVWLSMGASDVDILDPWRGRIRTLRADPAHPLTALPKVRVLAISQTPSSEVYLATEEGLYRSDAKGDHLTRLTIPGQNPTGRFSALLADGGTLWVGGRGLWALDVSRPGKIEVLRHISAPALGGSLVVSMALGPDGTLWVGSREGLARVHGVDGAVQRVPTDASDPTQLTPGYLASMLFDTHGRLWVSSFGAGVQMLEHDGRNGRWKFRRLGRTEGLPNTGVDDLVQDHHGQIWASTDGGLAVINPDTFAIRSFQRAQGLDIETYWTGAGAATAEGELLFGGSGGLTVVRPDLLSPRSPPVPVVVTDVRVGARPVPVGRFNLQGGSIAPLEISPHDGGFSVEFSALDYAAPENNRYAYRLEGYDPSWTSVDAEHRIATYANLPPGDYRLQIRGSNRDGIWSAAPLSLAVRVLPAWNQTWWFKLLLIAAGIFVVLILTQVRTAVLRQRQRELEHQVAERTEALRAQAEDLTRARIAAEASTQAKSEFLANMSHEIRTPLNGVLGMASLLLNMPLGPNQRKYVEVIRGSGHDLLTILNDILDISKLESGKVELEIIAFDLSESLTRVVGLLEPRAREKGSEIIVQLDPSLTGWFSGDPTRIRQILLNLIGNAIKFTESGTVTVKVSPVDTPAAPQTGRRRIRFEVADDGIGMSDSVRSHLFQNFSQADSSISRRYGGTGLGLAICKQLCDLMGGEIGVTSKLGEGSTFWFEIALPVADNQVAANNLSGLSAPDAGPSGRKLRILLAEDHPINQLFMQAVLEQTDHEVVTVADGRQAVDAVRGGGFDLVLMDVQMPELDGVAATRQIRALPGPERDVTIIALTANAMSGVRETYLAAGMNDYLSKPVDPTVLLDRLSEFAATEGPSSYFAQSRGAV